VNPRFAESASVVDLIRSGVLARPVYHTVDTGERVELTRQEIAALGGADLPASVLRRLDADRRNETILDRWLAQWSQWSKTLVFAVDVDHADRLHERFVARGAEALVLHTRSELSRHDVIEHFRAANGPCVFVSVGMLTESVDLPTHAPPSRPGQPRAECSCAR
jgi:superfamily II DNA or RNA helicase